MASFEPTSPEPSAHDILAFNDAELVQYIQRNRRPDGHLVLNPEGWDTLPKDQRNKLAERLRFGARKAGEGVQSRAVDLDQVTARLLEANTHDTSPRVASAPRRRERSPTRSPPGIDADREYERAVYKLLVDAGGRPCFPVTLLEAVSENPEEYRALLRPWQEADPDTTTPDWKVFWSQLERWETFRIWQLVNRGIYDVNIGYLAYVEKRKHLWTVDGDLEELAGLEADSSYIKWAWDWAERVRRRDFPHLWWLEMPKATETEEVTKAAPDADDCPRLYVEKVKLRLARHGFARSIRLEKDPKRQDELTTWIEYLNYEYSWYDWHTRKKDRLQIKHDEAWKKLVDSGVLRPGETEEYLLSDECAFRRNRELTTAENALKSAEAAAQVAENQRSELSIPEREQRLARAQSELVAAQEAYEATQTRRQLIHHYRASRQVQWQLDLLWKKLVDSGVLQAGETKEYLLSQEFGLLDDEEWLAVSSAKKAVQAAENFKNQHSSLSIPERERRLARAQSRLVSAQEAWKVVKRRDKPIDEFIRGTMEYRSTKRDIFRQSIIVQWVLEQVPLIEAELKSELGAADTPASSREAQPASPRSSQATSHRVRSGRVTKNASRRRLGRGTPTFDILEELGTPNVDKLDGLGDNSRTAARRKRQRKTYEKERASRRLAGQVPQSGTLLEQGEAPPPYEASLRQPSEGKTSTSVTRSTRLSKKSAVKGAKPQGIRRSKQPVLRTPAPSWQHALRQ